MVRIVALDSHVVGLAHFELNKTVNCIILDYVCYIELILLSARAVRLDMFDRP